MPIPLQSFRKILSLHSEDVYKGGNAFIVYFRFLFL